MPFRHVGSAVAEPVSELEAGSETKAPMRIRALMYHDVLGDGSGADASGSPGALASR